MEPQHLDLRGGRLAFRRTGSGPVVVLLHGMASSSDTWEEVLPLLGRSATVIAPDLPGHGGSTNPGGDYSLGSHASSVRDLMVALDVPHATIVGHSFGGGVAMQLAYQFPERCERLVLVDSGGLGREVALGLRLLSLPGAELALAVGCAPRVLEAGRTIGRWFGRIGVQGTPSRRAVARSYASLVEPQARTTLVRTLRAVVNGGGQAVNANVRLALAAALPTLIIWGERDRIIPASHAASTHAAIPGSELITFPDAGHFPHADDPAAFADALARFIDEHPAATWSEDQLRALLQAG